ncbi:MAG: hypothetical protein KF745_05350 [Phycisphaeraceae bacterium]|nr:hypothetical protein [Phycisphaeraceae bacterium]
MMPSTPRDYSAIASQLPRAPLARDQAMPALVDALWTAYGHDTQGPGRSISWVGFYLHSPGSNEMVLGPRRDKPACSPISLAGACGRAFNNLRPLVVTDVARLGAGYIACDVRDRSELIIPCLDTRDRAWGVLDLDSYDTGAFSVADAVAIRSLLVSAGLSVASSAGVDVV